MTPFPTLMGALDTAPSLRASLPEGCKVHRDIFVTSGQHVLGT